MGTIADIGDAVRRLNEQLESTVTIDLLTFFEEFVAPTYSSLKIVHLDYLDLFSELRARVAAPDGISDKTLNWLSAVRTKHQFARSELRVIKFPELNVIGKQDPQLLKLTSALDAYVKSIREYLCPHGESRYEIINMAGAPVVRSTEPSSLVRRTQNVLEEIVRLTRTTEELTLEIMDRTLRAAEVRAHDFLEGLEVAQECLSVATGADNSVSNTVKQNAPLFKMYYDNVDLNQACIVPGEDNPIPDLNVLQEEIDNRVEELKTTLSKAEKDALREKMEVRAQRSILEEMGQRQILFYINLQTYHLERQLSHVQSCFMDIKVLCVPTSNTDYAGKIKASPADSIHQFFTEAIYMAGDHIENKGQAGIVGKVSQIDQFQQIWMQEKSGLDLNVLALELGLLRRAMKERAKSDEPEHDAAIGAVAVAEREARVGNGEGVFQYLAAAGKWAIDVAREIGVAVAKSALEKAIGVQ